MIGPPGCGKTTWLSRQVQRAVDEGKDVVVASLTKAAAAEAAAEAAAAAEPARGTGSAVPAAAPWGV